MSCNHTNPATISTHGYSGSVSPYDENRAAHGGVCHTEECRQCGARRRVNANGRHYEYGTWGESRAEREDRARLAAYAARALCDRRPPSVRLVRGSESAEVTIDADGYIVTRGTARPSDAQILAAVPALVEYARELRLAVQHAEQLKDEV